MTFTRRTFMETTCALSAGLVFGSVAHASTKVPEKWDETCSLLVIGTGFAGLGAALESPGRTHQKLSNEPRYRSPFIGDLTRGTF